MIKNYFTIAYRNLVRHRVFATLNILGLAVGIASAILIYAYVRQETNYDTFHQHAEDTYRLTLNLKLDDKKRSYANNSVTVFDKVTQEIPEISQATKIAPFGNTFIEYQSAKFTEEQVWYADEQFFNVFSHQFLQGQVQGALDNPNSIVLTKSLAKKLFGDINAVGKAIKVNEDKTYQVTAVIADVPYNTHYRFQALVSMATLYNTRQYKQWKRCIDCTRIYMYCTFKSGIDQVALETKMFNLFKEHRAVKSDYLVGFNLQPLTDIHLHSKLNNELQSNGNLQFVYTFLIIAILILLIAVINYMNLATAKSLKRAKEVGIRKVMGSYRSQLIFQFLTESLIIVYLALGLGVLLADLMLPFISQIAPKPLSYKMFDLQFNLSVIIGGTVLGLLSGIYPAFILSGFKPVKVLKSGFQNLPQGVTIRKVLVVVQFTISSVLIVSTIIAYQQLRYMQNQNLGFDQEQVVVMDLPTLKMKKKVPVLKQALLQNPGVKSVAFSSGVPGASSLNTNYTYIINDQTRDTLEFLIPTLTIDYDYLKTMGLELKQGRNFDITRTKDTTKAAIINESLAKKIGWKNLIGKRIGNYGIKGRIIGIMPDYHFKSLHDQIEPTMYHLQLSAYHHQYALVKIQPKNMQTTLSFIESTWKKFEPNRLYKGFFLDQNFEKQYRADQQREVLFIAFATLAIVIACLGLFGLAAYTVERRIKEIGIRKVLGATVANILKLISRSFLSLIVIANLIAIPLGYWLMNRWLDNFAYHIEVSWWVFCIAMAMVIITALVTISYQTLKASLANPVEAMRYE
ncbi:MAG TPA: hypothetical protein DCS93_01555 [Microscillaceae bacterium]|nr:hypothetical protein [Microscillaceae bacterium]